jgi:myeloid leukemia factor 1
MFDDDPFFADHRQMMDSMMSGMGFGRSGFGAIEDGRQSQRGDQRVQRRQDGRSSDPFQMMHQQMNSMMQNFGRGMMSMESNGGNDGHMFTHSSVYSYTNDGQGPPKVFQAASEERRAPGGIRESKKAVRDSQSGMQKMAVGHHIQDRGHVIERSQNMHTGDREERQNFIGMTEDQGQSFHDEWTRVSQSGQRRNNRGVTFDDRRGSGNVGQRQSQRALPSNSHYPRDDMINM